MTYDLFEPDLNLKYIWPSKGNKYSKDVALRHAASSGNTLLQTSLLRFSVILLGDAFPIVRV